MECIRCQGLMIVDHYIDIAGSSMLVRTWRCLNCGSVVDPLIDHHRQLQRTGALQTSEVPGQEQDEESSVL